MSRNDLYLSVYKDHSVLHQGDKVTTFIEGQQNQEAKNRYSRILAAFNDGFFDKTMLTLAAEVSKGGLTDEQQETLVGLVDGLTSEVGRAVVGLVCLQLAIKAIEPSQCIRLHKGAKSDRGFSWCDGISMRTLDNKFNTPFLRKYGLLNMNKDGIMMTRSLAENYPYSELYKAEIRGPVKHWIEVVESLENGALPPLPALCHLLSLLKNRSDDFSQKAKTLLSAVSSLKNCEFSSIRDTLVAFYDNAEYSARAFEVVIHALMQALSEMGLVEGELVPLSQMRSANKKHGNVGDIEIRQGDAIIESWDAKYGKPYLRDELEELNDKLFHHPNVELCGFIVNADIDRRKDVLSRISEIETLRGCHISLFSMDEWLREKTKDLSADEQNTLGGRWLVAVAESFCQRRNKIAPIDEPCDVWITELAACVEKLR